MGKDEVCRDMDALDPVFRERLEATLTAAKEAGLTLLVIETYRGQDRQNYLYTLGRRGIEDEKKVTWTRQSKHLTRCAADVAVEDDLDYDGALEIDWNNAAAYRQFGEIAEACGLVWGGRFKNYDGGHVQDPTA